MLYTYTTHRQTQETHLNAHNAQSNIKKRLKKRPPCDKVGGAIQDGVWQKQHPLCATKAGTIQLEMRNCKHIIYKYHRDLCRQITPTPHVCSRQHIYTPTQEECKT